MLDQKDLSAIREIMKEEVSASEQRILKTVRKEMVSKKELAASENMILGELDRVEERLNARMDKLEKDVGEIKQFYRVTKLEKDTTTTCLNLMDDLDKRVTSLDNRVTKLEHCTA